MKKFKSKNITVEQLDTVICNMCAKEIEKEFEDMHHDYIEVNKSWGYFSSFDGEKHSFDICEECYKKIIAEFKIPVEKK